jgi:branched-chain amino acid transport system substrate-binding protein
MNTKKFTLFAFLLAIVVLIVGFSACDRVSRIVQPATPQMTEASEDISIGVVLPLTGRLTDTFGIPISQGFELALSEINATHLNGAQLKFIIEDDQSTIDGAVEAFNKLIHQDKVSVILGPATSSQTREAFQVAQENEVVALGPTSAARGLSAIGDFVFRISLTTDVLIPIGIEVTHAKLGYQRVATIYDETDLFSTDGNEAVREALAANGVEVLTTEIFQGGDDVSAQLTRIQALNPDAVFVSALPTDRPNILTQRHQLGLSVPFFVRTLTGVDIKALGAPAEGAISFVGWSSMGDAPGNQAFVQNYSAEYGTEPNNYAASAYATVYILAEALANAQSADSTAIRDALANIKDFDTIFGKFSFDANGDAVYEPKVLIVNNGEFELFE